MALVPSTMVPLGSPLPDITLADPDGASLCVPDLLAGRRGLLVLFLSNHCPYVRHLQRILGPLASDLRDQGIGAVGIHSNDAAAYPSDGPAEVARVAREHGYGFPQAIDETQGAARAFGAACTPDAFLYDHHGALVYRGQLDDTRPGGGRATGADVRAAAKALWAGDPPIDPQRPSTGCSIKWKPGQAPGGRGWLT